MKAYEEDLRRIGIDEELIHQAMQSQNPEIEMCRIRKVLLERIHSEQKKLQELDYLIYRERKDGQLHG